MEREGDRLFDSAIMIVPDGNIVLKYRRISPGWHGRDADSLFYTIGDQLEIAKTKFGSLIFLICGDLFDSSIVSRVRNMNPDWFLYPFTRSFDDSSFHRGN